MTTTGEAGVVTAVLGTGGTLLVVVVVALNPTAPLAGVTGAPVPELVLGVTGAPVLIFEDAAGGLELILGVTDDVAAILGVAGAIVPILGVMGAIAIAACGVMGVVLVEAGVPCALLTGW